MPIDLMAFNGVTEDADPQVNPTTKRANDRLLCSRSEGQIPRHNDLWTQEPLTGSVPKPNTKRTLRRLPASGFNFMAQFNHTLSYLERSVRRSRTPAGRAGRSVRQRRFPWLTWNNRPFVSQIELLLVPWAKSSQTVLQLRS